MKVSQQIFTAIGGLMGAAGVALSAAAAHRAGEPNLGVAANFLMFHAPVFLAVGLIGAPKFLRLAASVLLVGVLLFSGDLLARVFLGDRLFPFAAPSGGVLMIAGWLLIAGSAFVKAKPDRL
jgi:uncharacterized membrane protein YgdD (TMEM256/DUF423 family)